MMKLSQLAENKIKKLQNQNQQEQKKSMDSDDRLKEAIQAGRQLRQQELRKKIEYFLNISFNLAAPASSCGTEAFF